MTFGKAAQAKVGALGLQKAQTTTFSDNEQFYAWLTKGVWGDGSHSEGRDRLTKARARQISRLTSIGVRLFLIMVVGWISLSEEIYVPVLDDFSIWIIMAMLGELTRVLAKMMKPDA